MRRETAALYCFYVFACGVAHISVPSVLWVFEGELAHIFVAPGFREYGCGGYAGVFPVAFHHGLIGVAVEGFEAVAVYEQELRSDTKVSYGSLHARDGGVENVDSVYFLRTHLLHGPRDCLAFNDGPQFVALLFRHLLRVVQQGMMEVFREYDRSGKDGTCERTSSSLVTARFNKIFVEKPQKLDILFLHRCKCKDIF